MRECAYCGRENTDAASVCAECGTELPQPKAEPASDASIRPPLEPPLPALAGLDMGFEVVEGFSRPNWQAIVNFVHENIAKDDWAIAWSYIAQKWLYELAADLGGGARVDESANFFCLSDLAPETRQPMLVYAESALNRIRITLKEAAWTGAFGKHVLLVFADSEDYAAYIAYFLKEGVHPMSSGVFIRAGYAHIAFPYVNARRTEHVVVHELVHNLVCHLPIPGWLNEGLAVAIERSLSRVPFLLDGELVERHRRFWNENTIQQFWAGASFHEPGESNELSYSLAEIFVNLLSEKGPDFGAFVQSADWRDGGQDAALACLDASLEDIAATFLGPGNWRPQRKAISEIWPARPEGRMAATGQKL